MLIATTENIAGQRVKQTLGQVFGLVVRSRGLAGDITAGLRSIVGGEITEYTEMLEDARRHAIDRMVANAQTMGADAVVMMRFDSSELGQSMSEVVAYGTAVKLESGS
ncbi:MAG: YbjQ family protein [Vulcanimicrobiaceae bacterium]